MRMLPTGRTREHGFTLVELAVVTLIMVALAAVAAPSFAGFQRASQARNCAWGVATLARRARDYAICHGVRVALEYDGEERRFLLAQETDPGRFEPLALAGALPVAAPDSVEAIAVSVEGQEAGPESPVVFFPDGQALRAEIMLERPQGRLTVTIAPLTGRVRVVEGDAGEPAG